MANLLEDFRNLQTPTISSRMQSPIWEKQKRILTYPAMGQTAYKLQAKAMVHQFPPVTEQVFGFVMEKAFRLSCNPQQLRLEKTKYVGLKYQRWLKTLGWALAANETSFLSLKRWMIVS